MKLGIFLSIRHRMDGDNGVEQCTLKRELKNTDYRKSSIIIDVLNQSIIKNSSGYDDQNNILDHFFKKYKDEIGQAITDLLNRAEKYPYIAKQIEKHIDASLNTNNN